MQGETLDSMVLFGERHLHHVIKKIERHHNAQRPYQGIGNRMFLMARTLYSGAER